eukprot:6490994-Amphidinium_carterae.3
MHTAYDTVAVEEEKAAKQTEDHGSRKIAGLRKSRGISQRSCQDMVMPRTHTSRKCPMPHTLGQAIQAK